tara:strand:- start:535 stop:711 length:177 start_codon:yes stop_codon:yes gene_type:complete
MSATQTTTKGPDMNIITHIRNLKANYSIDLVGVTYMGIWLLTFGAGIATFIILGNLSN